MIERSQFTAGAGDPPHAVPLSENCTVPTAEVAYLLRDLLATDGRVLEIGTGSGYQTAVLAEKCFEVVSIEKQPRTGIEELLPANVTIIRDVDGCEYDTGEKFDGVLVTFAAHRIMHAWFTQLRDGGRLVVPLKSGRLAKLCTYVKRNGRLELLEVTAYAPFTEEA